MLQKLLTLILNRFLPPSAGGKWSPQKGFLLVTSCVKVLLLLLPKDGSSKINGSLGRPKSGVTGVDPESNGTVVVSDFSLVETFVELSKEL